MVERNYSHQKDTAGVVLPHLLSGAYSLKRERGRERERERERERGERERERKRERERSLADPISTQVYRSIRCLMPVAQYVSTFTQLI